MLLPALCVTCACVAPDSRVDFSGIDRFWEIAETFQRDEVPTPAQWQALFATPGYAVRKRHDRADRLLEALLPLALSPSRAADRAKYAAAGDWRSLYVDHFRGAMKRRKELEELRKSLRVSDLTGAAMAKVAGWLPAGTLESASRPEVSFVILEPDARGYERIVMDLSLALDLGADFARTIAHETHHVYRNQITLVRRPEGAFPERDLVASLDNLQAEGIADQIDKSDYLDRDDWGDSPVQRRLANVHSVYKRAHARADETLAGMDRLLAAYLADPSSADRVGRELRSSLVLGGHPVGFHMASTVIEAFGRARIIEHVGDPFAFVLDYNEAAKRLGGGRHVFTAEALAAVERLARRFRRQSCP